jgi:hypothetical protein
MEILVDKLAKAARFGQKKGWHRDELGLSDGKRPNHKFQDCFGIHTGLSYCKEGSQGLR